jgi:hypothetical protein
LERVINNDPRIQLESHYDWENERFVHNLLKSDLDIHAMVEEMSERAWHHSRYFNGDRDYSNIREHLIRMYNAVSKVFNKPSFESQFGDESEALSYACQVIDSNPGMQHGRTGLKRAREKVKLKIERKDLLVPVLGELPAAGLYWVEFIIHDDDHEGRGSYHNFFGPGRTDAFANLYVPEGPNHIRYYPVIKDKRTFATLTEDIKQSEIEGFELVNADCCDDPRYKSPTIWKLVTKPVLRV